MANSGLWGRSCGKATARSGSTNNGVLSLSFVSNTAHARKHGFKVPRELNLPGLAHTKPLPVSYTINSS
jgi:hypothetical protein